MNTHADKLRRSAAGHPGTNTGDVMRSAADELDRQQARVKKLEDELTRQLEWEYNAFEPDNQSVRYRRMHAVLHKG